MKAFCIFVLLIIQFSVPLQTFSKNIAANRCESSFAGLGYKHSSGGGDFVMELIINSKKHGIHTVYYDDEDHEEISKYTWSVSCPPGSRTLYASGYFGGDPRRKLMHSFLTGYKITDHIDGNGLNNKRCNLRECTFRQNTQNQRRRFDSTTGYKGVAWSERDKIYYVQICVDGKRLWGGQFSNPVSAAEKYNSMALELFGEFAKINEISDSDRLLWGFENRKGKARKSTTGYRGVYVVGRYNNILARVVHKRKTYRLGFFESLESAAIAYNNKAVELKGSLAMLNVIPNE